MVDNPPKGLINPPVIIPPPPASQNPEPVTKVHHNMAAGVQAVGGHVAKPSVIITTPLGPRKFCHTKHIGPAITFLGAKRF